MTSKREEILYMENINHSNSSKNIVIMCWFVIKIINNNIDMLVVNKENEQNWRKECDNKRKINSK